MRLRKKEKNVMSRVYVINSLLLMVFAGAFFGLAIAKCFEAIGILSVVNVSICMVLYSVFCVVCWLPLTVPSIQIMDIDEEAMYMMPKYSNFKKMHIAWYALLNDHCKPFYRMIPFEEVNFVTFSFDAQYGSYAFQRFSYKLVFHIGEEKIKVYLNPQQNGFLMPSGFGIPFAETLSREDIVNQIDFYKANHIEVRDPYKLSDALKDESVVMYDYLVSLHKNIKY